MHYVVIGESGEYSDYHMWVVCVCISMQGAKEELGRLAKAHAEAKEAQFGTKEQYRRGKGAYPLYKNETDSGADEYASYRFVGVPVRP